MNTIKKVQEIRRVLTDRKDDLCPYCDEKLTTFIDKKGHENRMCDNHEGEYIIDLTDYLDVMSNIIDRSNVMDDPIKYKKITDF